MPTLEPVNDTGLLDDNLDDQRKLEDLIRMHLETLDLMPAPVENLNLQFINNPRVHGPYIYDYSQDGGEARQVRESSPNTGPHALDTTANCNKPYLVRENTLWELSRTLQSFIPTPTTLSLLERATEALSFIELYKAMQWETLRAQESGEPYFNTGELDRE